MSALNHYTITTGHNWVSPRSEVGAEALAALAPMLRSGTHAMPGFPEYRVIVTEAQAGDQLTATVLRGDSRLVTMIVCSSDQALADAIRFTGCVPAVSLTVPALLVDVHPTASGDPALDWLGDFERCLAWAWLEREA